MKAIGALTIIILYGTSFGATHEVPWDLIKKIMPHNPVVVEAGAQFGEDSQLMAEMWPNGTIYSFEPMPSNYALLEKVAEHYTNIIISRYALTNEKKSAQFWVCGGASSLLRPLNEVNRDYFHADLEHPIQVDCISLDEWRLQNKVPVVDFLWFDMEGNELNALKGAESTLQQVSAIFIEVNLRIFWHENVLYTELKDWLQKHGFTEKWSSFVPHWNGNVLFIKDR